ncbi:hypothetical protein HDV00_002878 [Rhizophlyctis rosea]|nr:hypothetical protein HDV00_002878 [Rhizophlyctis rosea]
MDPAKQEALSQFVSFTGSTNDQAQFWLEANNWNVESATAGFFDAQGESEGGAAAGASTSSGGPLSGSGPFAGEGPFSGSGPFQGSSSSQGQPKKGGGSSRIKSFRDLGNEEEDESEEEDDRENFFAGGEKSGVMMQGGPKKAGGPQDLIKDIIQKAANAGPAPEEFQKSKKPAAFQGSGYRLGSEEDQQAGPSVPATQPSSAPKPVQAVERHLTFWRNGFSIEDGPLLDYNAPENQEFLRSINSGRAPTALLNVAYDQPVEVKVAHKLDEDYKPPPKKPAAAFSGSGQRLGGITTGQASTSQSSAPTQPSSSSAPPAHVPAVQFSVDQSQPVTSIQIRLADGTRLVAKFNHTHTVADLRQFINASRPGEASRAYILQTTFPVKELSDNNATIKDAGLLNAVVVQRYT